MSPVERAVEIERLERVIPLLTNLGDVAIQQRRLDGLRVERDALTLEAVAA